jgi:hypothetical protein
MALTAEQRRDFQSSMLKAAPPLPLLVPRLRR